jgi:hypothetical protein
MSGLTASNLRRLDKGQVLASVDISIPAWHLKLSCLWMSKDGGEWISLPVNKFTTREGKTAYTKLVEITDEVAYKRFQAAALAAAHKLNDDVPAPMRSGIQRRE